MPRRKPIQQARQTMVWLSEEDYALLEYLQRKTGIRARVEVIRAAIRQYARQIEAEEIQAIERRRATSPAAGEDVKDV